MVNRQFHQLSPKSSIVVVIAIFLTTICTAGGLQIDPRRLCMNASNGIVFGILLILSYVGTPIMLIWGWKRWASQPKLRTIPSILFIIGFIFATTSALLAVSTIALAQVHHFAFYDPLLLRMFKWGFLLSLAGILFGVSGIWRSSSIRWHSPVSGLGMLTFWFIVSSFE